MSFKSDFKYMIKTNWNNITPLMWLMVLPGLGFLITAGVLLGYVFVDMVVISLAYLLLILVFWLTSAVTIPIDQEDKDDLR